MRRFILACSIILAGTMAAMPSQAQGGTFMWCQATADNGSETTVYYSAFFSAGAHQAEAKARAFKSEVENAEVSASTVTSECMAPADYDTAVAARNAAMKSAPGEVLDWKG